MPDRPEPTFREIIQSIKRIINENAGRREADQKGAVQKPRRGLSPGLLLMAIVALVITILAAVKNMK